MKTNICFIILSFFLASCIYVAAKDTPVHKNSTVIKFKVQSGDSTTVTVYNLLGNFIAEKSFHDVGLNRISIDTFNLSVGVYLIRIKTSHSSILKKVYVVQ